MLVLQVTLFTKTASHHSVRHVSFAFTDQTTGTTVSEIAIPAVVSAIHLTGFANVAAFTTIAQNNVRLVWLDLLGLKTSHWNDMSDISRCCSYQQLRAL